VCGKIGSVIESDVRQFLVSNYLLGEDPSSLPGQASLIEAGLIDSTGVLELVGYLEDQFEIRIVNEELLPENLDSIDNIVAFVTRKRGESLGAAA
jgi:acyl carrier protein